MPCARVGGGAAVFRMLRGCSGARGVDEGPVQSSRAGALRCGVCRETCQQLPQATPLMHACAADVADRDTRRYSSTTRRGSRGAEPLAALTAS